MRPSALAFGTLLVIGAGARLPGQTAPSPLSVPRYTTGISAGSIDEHRLRDGQRLGTYGITPVGMRPLPPFMLTRSLDRNWSWRSRSVEFHGPDADLYYSRLVPPQANDGPVWVGAGFTAAATGGVVVRLGPLSMALRPVAFWAANAAADSLGPTLPGIDRPHRLGPHAYRRVDPGESWIRLDSPWLAAGFSTAAQVWGPAVEYPLILGNAAGGFPHTFLETPRPLGILIGTVTARVMTGELAGSSFGATSALEGERRLGAGLVAVFVPRGLEGFEVGGTRFFHRYSTSRGFSPALLRTPFEGFLKADLANDPTYRQEADNQLASVFLRVAPSRSGFEAYLEFGRDDHSWDVRDLSGEPAHDAALTVGFRRASDQGGIRRIAGFELTDSRFGRMNRLRGQAPFGTHGRIVEGHASGGQPLNNAWTAGGRAVHLSYAHVHGDGALRVWTELGTMSQVAEGGSTVAGFDRIGRVGVATDRRTAGLESTMELILENRSRGDERSTNLLVSFRSRRR